jgi:hypothetical protein
MTEENTPEVELKDTPASGMSDAVNAVVNGTVKMVDSLARALITTAEDVSSLMVLRVDPDTREHLDLLVEGGLAANRRQAAKTLIYEGIDMKEETFERIRRTKTQIVELRKQMRNLVETRAA